MKRFIKTIIFTILFSSVITGQQITSYKPGEKISYNIHYGVITGGIATLELYNDTINERTCWHSKLIAKTTGITDAIYRVLDIYESCIDPFSELPVKSVRNIREGRYRKYNVVMFDHKTRPDSAILTSDLTGVHITPPGDS
jgi:hypothetical protein